MKQVKVFKTDDGKLFDNHGKAMDHELALNLRGLLQSNRDTVSIDATDPMTIAAKIIAKNQDKFYERIAQYRRSKASLKAAETRKKG